MLITSCQITHAKSLFRDFLCANYTIQFASEIAKNPTVPGEFSKRSLLAGNLQIKYLVITSN